MNSQWDSNPHAKYPQVHHFMGGIEPPEVCATWHPLLGARLSLSPWEIEKSFSKAIYHVLDNTGQLLPSCFSQRHERVLLIYARTQGCSEPIAGYLPFIGTCFLHHRAFRVAYDSNWKFGSKWLERPYLQYHELWPVPVTHGELSVQYVRVSSFQRTSRRHSKLVAGRGVEPTHLRGMNPVCNRCTVPQSWNCWSIRMNATHSR